MSLPPCPGLLNSGTAVNQPAHKRNFAIRAQVQSLTTTASTATYQSDSHIWSVPPDSGRSYEQGSSVWPEDQRRTAEAAAL